jgi:hypothetical protein
MNFILTPGKLLPDIQSIKMFFCLNTEIPSTFRVKCLENDPPISKAPAMDKCEGIITVRTRVV